MATGTVSASAASKDGLYCRFYGLAQRPFNLAPDPRFLFLTPGHREALAQLMYGVQEHKGFILLTGEVGTGKTTLLRTLLSRFSDTTDVAFVMNSTLPFDELLEYILADFGVARIGDTRAQRLIALNRFLIERRRVGINTVIIIDEAQNLDIETLEQIRLLSNFEVAGDKLLQIVLAGQPELRVKLQRPELRQLRQRIGMRCAIAPLDAAQVEQYILNQLRVAGARDRQLFSAAAIRKIAQYSRGIPRVVNIVCDHSLLLGYAKQVRRVDVDLVQQVIDYLEEGESRARRLRSQTDAVWPRVARYTSGALVACGAGAAAMVAVAAYRGEALSSALMGSLFNLVQLVLQWWRP
jgi:type II secretory pathway predicted ATPase ExeA